MLSTWTRGLKMDRLAPGFRRLLGRRVSAAGGLPDFLIIGAQKSGTSSLHRYLIGHPGILQPKRKEVHFFDFQYHHGLSWYQQRFAASSPPHSLTFEASPYYIFHPHAARRIRQAIPHARLIVLLRNPVDRAYSHYRHEVKLKYESLPFEEALEREQERTGGEIERILQDDGYRSISHQHFSYLARGRYAEQLAHWFNYFDREQFLIMRSDDFFANTGREFRRITDFVGLPPWEPAEFVKYGAVSHERMDPATRRRLLNYFAPHNWALGELLNTQLAWDE